MRRVLWCGVVCLACGVGCQRAPELTFTVREAARDGTEIPAEALPLIRDALVRAAGTPARPRPLEHVAEQPEGPPKEPTPDEADRLQRLTRGAALYIERCAGCHGVTGDGNGPAAEHLYPRPRNYLLGMFKFTSTENSAKGLRSDIRDTIRRGAKGTSMPAFNLLPDEDLDALTDYVLHLAHRGELEEQLQLGALDEEFTGEDEQVPVEFLNSAIDAVLGPWAQAEQQIVHPLSVPPKKTPETIALGEKAFKSEVAGCVKCHGDDGRGQTSENQKGFTDSWGFQTRAADLTAGMYHGGGAPLDIYRRIYAGVKGSPMPAFAEKLKDQPDTFWHLVHYVEQLAGQRRREVVAQQQAWLKPTDYAPEQPASRP